MALPDFSAVQNQHFVLRRCSACDGQDTPMHFVCPHGLRPWSRFFYLVQGEIDYRDRNGKLIHIRAGDLMYFPYDVAYTAGWTACSGGYYHLVQFILETPEGETINFHDDICLLFHDHSGRFLSMFEDLTQTVAQGKPGFPVRCQAQFLQLLSAVVAECSSQNVETRFAPIAAGIQYLENHYLEDVTTQELARLCHMSPSAFRRNYHEYAGMSPLSRRTQLRMHLARELLSSGNYTVSQAAAAVNISDPFYFSRVFKKAFGYSPNKLCCTQSTEISPERDI